MKIAICICIVILTQQSIAQSAEDDIYQVLQSKTALAQKSSFPDDTQIAFEFFLVKEPATNIQIDQLRQSATTDPTAAVRLEKMLSENAEGGVRRKVRLFYGNESTWRTSNDLLGYSLIPSVDMAQNGNEGYWVLTGRQLQRADNLSNIDSEVGFNPNYYFALCQSWLNSLSTGVVWDTSSEINLDRLELMRSTAKATIRVAEMSYDVTLARSFDADGDDWSGAWIQRVDLLEFDSGEVVGSAAFGDWAHSDVFNRYLAGKQTVYKADGSVETVLTLVSSGPLSTDIDQLVQVPATDGDDILRGRNTFTSIKNYTTNNQTKLDLASREILEVVRAENEQTYLNKVIIGLLVVLGAVGAVQVIKKIIK